MPKSCGPLVQVHAGRRSAKANLLTMPGLTRWRASLLAIAALLVTLPQSHAYGNRAELMRLIESPLTAAPGTSEAESEAVTAETQRYPWLFPRSTADRPDERSGPQIHVVYLVASDYPDERLDELGVLEDSMRSVNHWFRQQSGNLQWRVDTYTFEWDDPATPAQDPIQVPAIDVSFLRSERPGSELADLDAVIAELDAHGFDEPNKRYLSFVTADAGVVCGVSRSPSLPSGFEPTDSDPNEVGNWPTVFLFSVEGCHSHDFAPNPTTPSWVEAISTHEIIHNDGIVPPYAPHYCWPGLGHVCTAVIRNFLGPDPETPDLMYINITGPLTEKVLDRGHDDYFRHPFTWRDLEQSPYLESA